MDIVAIAQLLSAIAIIVLILLQDKSSGAGGLFGGGGGGGGELHQKRRGMEKIIFRSTIATIIIFLGLSLINLIL